MGGRSSGLGPVSFGSFDPVRECFGLVVGLSGVQAVVEDAQVAVGEVACGGAVVVAAVATAVVVGASSWRGREERQGPEVADLAESFVAHDAGRTTDLVPDARVTGQFRRRS